MSLFTDIKVAEHFVIYSVTGGILGVYIFMIGYYCKKLYRWIKSRIEKRKVQHADVKQNIEE